MVNDFTYEFPEGHFCFNLLIICHYWHPRFKGREIRNNYITGSGSKNFALIYHDYRLWFLLLRIPSKIFPVHPVHPSITVLKIHYVIYFII